MAGLSHVPAALQLYSVDTPSAQNVNKNFHSNKVEATLHKLQFQKAFSFGGYALASQKHPKRLMVRWATFKGLAALILFIFASALVEYFTVAYAVSLGVEDQNPLQWSFQFPGTSWTATLRISLLFHIVPMAAIIALTFSWICLTKYVALRAPKTPEEKFKHLENGKLTSKIGRAVKNYLGRIKHALLRSKGVAYFWGKASFAKTAMKSALTMLIAFSLLLLLFSLSTYPRLIHRAVLNLYQNNPSTLEFVRSAGNAVKGLAETLAPIGWACAAINNALVAMAPSFRAVAAGFGSLIKPLAELPPTGKYLFFQNFAVWVSALAVLFYGKLVRKSYRHRRIKRS
jgi:hypothetical protein